MPTILTINQIKIQYPNEWVVIGNPQMTEDTVLSPIVDKIINGVVLLHSKDKRELAYQTAAARKEYQSIACIYTGIFPQKRKYWL
jgi:hypothetical protein